jgi:6-phosphogluconolactonase
MRLGARQGGEKSGVGKLAAGVAIVLAAAVTLGLTGCGSFFSSSSNATHLGFIAGGVNSVSAYRIDNKTAVATVLVGSPYVAGNSPSGAVVTAAGQFLYVANQGDGTISLFSINSSSGALTEVLPRTSVAGMISPGPMTMDSGGSFLFVGDQVTNAIFSFKIGASGALTPVSSLSVGSSPAGLVLTTAGFLYVPVPNFSDIAVLSVNSGVMQLVGLFPVANGVAGIAVDSAAKFLYATNPTTNTVSGFSIQANGGLTPVLGLTVATQATPVAAVVDLSGKYLYVANSGTSNVSEFTIDATTGALTANTITATIGTGTNPVFVENDPDGKFVYVGNTGSQSITEFLINADGTLSNLNTISVSFVPRSLAPAP